MEVLRPINDRVLARRYLEEAVTPGGIIIPDNAQKTSQRAKVVAVGAGRKLADGSRLPIDCKVGDFILIGKHAGTVVEMNGEAHVAVREEDILAVESEE